MAQNYTEQLRKDNVRDAIYEDLQNNCEVLRTSWSGNAFPANPKVGQPCYRVDEDKLYYWDGYKWSQKGGGGSAELKTMELAAATSERVSITLEGARCLDKNMMFVFVDKIAQDPSTYSMNDDGTVVNFNPAIPANAAVTLRWFDTDVGTFDTAIFASDAEFAAGELTNKAPNVKQVHSLSDQIQTSNANYVKSELQSNLLNYTTNRILEIPQDIKLELNNGTLTLKAGSKVYVPNGFKSDGTTPKFDEVVITNDVIRTNGFNAQHFMMYQLSSNNFSHFVQGYNLFSGSTDPTGVPTIACNYNTALNKMRFTGDGGSSWTDVDYSLPFAISTSNSSQYTSIDQVFNGFGYIGSTVFVLPNVKCQSSIGRNADGTCTNFVRTVSSVFTYEAGHWNNATLYFLLWTNACEGQDVRRFTRNKEFSSQAVTYSFDENENKWYFSNNSQAWSDSGFNLNIVGKFVIASGKITSFEPYTVDSILNSNLSNLSAAGQAKFDAKANIGLDNLNAAGQAKFDAKANIGLDNLNAAGQAKFDAKANIGLDNLNAAGQAKFDAKTNVSLNNLDAAGQAKFDAKANVDLNNLSTAGQAILNGKADINLSNLNNTGNAAASNLNYKGIRTVIETYVNGTSWYRLFSDGFIEQGGSQIFPFGTTTITLLFPAKILNVSGIRATINHTTPESNPMIGILEDGAKIQINTGSGESEYFFWKVEGYKK